MPPITDGSDFVHGRKDDSVLSDILRVRVKYSNQIFAAGLVGSGYIC